MDLMTTDIIGYIAGSLSVIAIIPQLVKILKTKDSKNLSLMTYTLYVIVQILWICYGIGRKDLQIIISNIVCMLLSIMIILLSIYHRYKTIVDTVDTVVF
jgi:MtN3 and saliva related transmembrane protein